MLQLKTTIERNARPAAHDVSSVGSVSASLTHDDFTGEYRAVLDELVASRLARHGLKSADSVSNVIMQSLMRVVYDGQQQRMPLERLREMVTGSRRQRRDHSDWKPQAAIERQSVMLAGSLRLRRIA